MQCMWRKLLVFFEVLSGPKFIFHTALGQYISAHQSVHDFAAAGFDGWTVRHVFFADMGGFVLHSSDFVPFPLTVRQVHYIVTNGHVDFHDVLVDTSVIEDKNKFDTLTRVLTAMQLIWFVIGTIARVALGIAITTLELSTIAFIFCTLFTCYFWRLKPQDVSSPISITLKEPLATVLLQAGPAASRPYSSTPLDFADGQPHYFQLIWRYLFNIPNAIGLPFHPVKRPINKIWDDRFPTLTTRGSALLAFVQFGFAGIHFGGWNFHFPSHMERLLWRVCSVYIVCSMVCTWSVLYWDFELLPWITRQLEKQHTETATTTNSNRSLVRRFHRRWVSSMLGSTLGRARHIRFNNSSDQNPDEAVPFLTVAILGPLGALYVCARGYIMIEDIINLRDLPASTFRSVDWSALIPHL